MSDGFSRSPWARANAVRVVWSSLCLALMLVLVSSCDSAGPAEAGEGAVSFVTERQAYAAGETVVLTITNTGGTRVRFGLCPDILERAEGSEWRRVNGFAPSCDLVVRLLNPGQQTTTFFSLPEPLASGGYRVRFDSVRDPDNRLLGLDSRLSNRFTVE